ncbi:hypothetical protein TRICI_006513 [Trichomonascus ciferrii]|uniref:Uncharacterized protein n=1 Tax=Trichomonascus ciferrii TaxID=44093 RepID=A0A6A1LJQ0_9ASCO|nr:hypothetical protein TRICI_006513 [Trichomonascus ciferrii]
MVKLENVLSIEEAKESLRKFRECKGDLSTAAVNETCEALETVEREGNEDEDDIARLLCDCVKPLGGEWIWYKDELTESRTRWIAQEQFLSVVPRLLHVLSKYTGPLIYRHMLVYSVEGYPWVRDNTIATKWLESNEGSIMPLPELVDAYIKPAFIKSASHPSVSMAGRKKINDDRGYRNRLNPTLQSDTEELMAPWRVEDQSVIALLEVVIRRSEPTQLRSVWPFLVPSMLNIVDDHEVMIKLKGCQFLELVVSKMDSQFLHTTGLIPIFRDAVAPTLHYLPPSIPTNLSRIITHQGVDTLLSLTASLKASGKTRDCLADMDSLMFDLLHAIANTNQKVELLISLLADMESLVQQLGPETVKYLQDLVKVYLNILGDPFIGHSPNLAIKTCEFINTVMTYAWPRLYRYRYEILRGAVLSYKRIQKAEASTQLIVPVAQSVIKKLTDALNDPDFINDLTRLVLSDESLNQIINF